MARLLSSLRGSDTIDTFLLFLTQPGLLGVAKRGLCDEVHKQAEDDEDEGDGVQEVDVVAEDFDTDDETPEGHGAEEWS